MYLIDIVLPLALVAALGYFLTKIQWLTKIDIDAISKLTFTLLIPLFLFTKMSKADLQGNVDIDYFLAFYLPLLISFFIALTLHYVISKPRKTNLAQASVFALGSSYSNTVIIGIPIVIAIVNEQALGLVFLIITFHSALLFTLTSLLAIKAPTQSTNTSVVQNLAKQTLLNPLVASITLGLIANLLDLHLPKTVDTAIGYLGTPAIGLALFLLGSSLTFYRIKEQTLHISLATILKLVLLPLLILMVSHHFLELPVEVTTTLVIISACPTGVNAYLIAKMQQCQQAVVAGTIVASTLASLITLPLWLLLLEKLT
ncbi:AEC family transporter [Thalassotalea ganghwensis]